MRRIGVDVGGTFTDLILVDEAAGAITVDKVPSTPDDPARAVMTGVNALCGKAGVSLEAVDLLLHGTTVATNITLEHKGAEVGLITTEVFETSCTSRATRSRTTSRSSRSCRGSRAHW